MTGCWQFIAVYRDRQKLRQGKVIESSQEYAFYVTSLVKEQATAEELAQHIRNHWAACENGSHYRRDVTLGEDASQISGRDAASAMTTLRNLTLGLFELQKDKGKTDASFLPEWLRKMTVSAALKLITKGV